METQRMPFNSQGFSRRGFLSGAAALTAAGLLAACSSPAPSGTSSAVKAAKVGSLEIFSFWTSGGDALALQSLYDQFGKKYPTAKITNSAIGGGAGAGANMKTVLTTRMLGGNPPDSFQVHVGAELIDTWVAANKMESLDFLYKDENYSRLFPKSLIEIASHNGKPYSVPVDILRANVLWFSEPIMDKVGGSAPTTWDEFFDVADKLKGLGIPAMGMAEATPGQTGLVFETILISKLGAKAYKGLFSGDTKWSDKRITSSLETLKEVFNYVNTDYLSFQRGDIPSLLSDGKAAMIIQSDFVNGYLKAKKFTDYGYAAVPDSKGVFDLASDSFGLPVGAKDRDSAIAWLKLCGSAAAQNAFNPLKGSISPRSDRDTTHYDDYELWSAKEFDKGNIVPSLYNGSAAKASFVTDYSNIMNIMATTKDVSSVHDKLNQAADDAGFAA
jgi:glucose/mannose transport system substrate-binding protein